MRATEDMSGYDALKREQAFNRMFRRCQIANVRCKDKAPIKPAFIPASPAVPYPWTVPPGFVDIFSLPPMHEACRGCIGKVCGNVACPSRPVVTCGPSPASFSNGGYASLSNGGA